MAPGDTVGLFADLLRAWHGDHPWLWLARRAEDGLAELLEDERRPREGSSELSARRAPKPGLDPDHVSLQDVADAEARLAVRQAAYQKAAMGMENLRALPVARWPDLLEHPAAQEHAPELAELLLENSSRHLEDDPRLAAAFAALAGLVLTRGPEHEGRPPVPGHVRVLAQLAKAAHAAALHGEPAVS